MTRIAVIGNSHVAALAVAWREVREAYPISSITFFAAPSIIRGLQVNGRKIVANNINTQRYLHMSSGGVTDIIVDDFHEFVICGMGFGLRSLMKIYSSYRSEAMRIVEDRAPVSDECFDASGAGLLGSSGAVGTLQMLRDLGAPKILLAPEPSPSSDIYGDDLGSPWREARANRDDLILSARYRRACDLAAAGALVLAQPADTMQDGVTTLPNFSRGSVGLAAGMSMEHGASDRFHMNADYGRCVLEQLLS
jgi:hypothetical protein